MLPLPTMAPRRARIALGAFLLSILLVGATLHAGPAGPPPATPGVPLPLKAGPEALLPPPTGLGAPGCEAPGMCPSLPGLPAAAPRPDAGPGSLASFVAGVSNNDAAFEVLLGQGRILALRENLAVPGKPAPLIAVGDPTVIDFIVVSPRQLRVVGKRIGTTDLSITTADGRHFGFQVQVVADLPVLTGQLRCLFPDASIRLSQVRDHVVVEGQARDTAQVARIIEAVRAYLLSVRSAQVGMASGQGAAPPMLPVPPAPKGDNGKVKPMAFQPEAPPPVEGPGRLDGAYVVSPEVARVAAARATVPPAQVINLLRVPGPQQVLLKVRVAELNRTALREIGADLLFGKKNDGSIVGTQIGAGTVSAAARVGETGGLISDRAATFFGTSPNTTVFGIFEGGDVAFLLRALRRNSILKLLAEPNLVALNGHQANFLAGGEFPVPIPQTSTGGAGTSVTVTFKEFGVRLGFLPNILDGDRVRLTVDPEVSSIDFSIGTVIVPGGTPVPGLNTRRSHTTVELRQGQTLAIAGLLQLTLDGQTNRIPGLGDLPILGPFFSNTSSTRTEKELIVLVTPYLVEPMNPGQVPPSPGDEVKAPNDLEFYLLSRIEGRTGRDHRATTNYDDPLRVLRSLMHLEDKYMCGPHGFGD